MKFLAKMKEKQMQRKIGGILCELLCAGGGTGSSERMGC